jgi:hypothetical protein
MEKNTRVAIAFNGFPPARHHHLNAKRGTHRSHNHIVTTSNQRLLAQHPVKLRGLNTRSPPSTHQQDWFCYAERKKHGSNAAIGRMQNLLPTVLPKNGLGIRIDIVRIVFDSWPLVPTAPNAFSAVDSLIFLILSWIIYCW